MKRHPSKPPRDDPQKCLAWIIEEQRRIQARMKYFHEMQRRLYKLQQAVWWMERLGHGFGPVKTADGVREYRDLD